MTCKPGSTTAMIVADGLTRGGVLCGQAYKREKRAKDLQMRKAKLSQGTPLSSANQRSRTSSTVTKNHACTYAPQPHLCCAIKSINGSARSVVTFFLSGG
jgi:hypothetical protein